MCVRVYCIAVFCVVCFFWVFFTFVAYCLPDNLYCVGGAVKPCSLTQSAPVGLYTDGTYWFVVIMDDNCRCVVNNASLARRQCDFEHSSAVNQCLYHQSCTDCLAHSVPLPTDTPVISEFALSS